MKLNKQWIVDKGWNEKCMNCEIKTKIGRSNEAWNAKIVDHVSHEMELKMKLGDLRVIEWNLRDWTLKAEGRLHE